MNRGRGGGGGDTECYLITCMQEGRVRVAGVSLSLSMLDMIPLISKLVADGSLKVTTCPHLCLNSVPWIDRHSSPPCLPSSSSHESCMQCGNYGNKVADVITWERLVDAMTQVSLMTLMLSSLPFLRPSCFSSCLLPLLLPPPSTPFPMPLVTFTIPCASHAPQVRQLQRENEMLKEQVFLLFSLVCDSLILTIPLSVEATTGSPSCQMSSLQSFEGEHGACLRAGIRQPVGRGFPLEMIGHASPGFNPTKQKRSSGGVDGELGGREETREKGVPGAGNEGERRREERRGEERRGEESGQSAAITSRLTQDEQTEEKEGKQRATSVTLPIGVE
eukprot:762949-Hanusia_phi.AAC.13